MEKIKILPGCISCGTCQVICPEVFKVTDLSHVHQDADLEKYKNKIQEAAQMCPVDAIVIEE